MENVPNYFYINRCKKMIKATPQQVKVKLIVFKNDNGVRVEQNTVDYVSGNTYELGDEFCGSVYEYTYPSNIKIIEQDKY